jgi:hypothetical protein
MSKIQVTLDASKLRNLVSKREYQNKQGETIQVQEVKFELVPVKEPKTIYTAEKYRIDKTHFASVIQSKEEREAKADNIYIGEGFTTIWNNSGQPAQVFNAVPVSEVKDEEQDDLPF